MISGGGSSERSSNVSARSSAGKFQDAPRAATSAAGAGPRVNLQARETASRAEAANVPTSSEDFVATAFRAGSAARSPWRRQPRSKVFTMRLRSSGSSILGRGIDIDGQAVPCQSSGLDPHRRDDIGAVEPETLDQRVNEFPRDSGLAAPGLFSPSMPRSDWGRARSAVHRCANKPRKAQRGSVRPDTICPVHNAGSRRERSASAVSG